MAESKKNGQEWLGSHSEAVRSAAPDVPAFAEGEKVAIWQQIEATATSPATRPTRRKAAAAAVAALAAVGVAGAATAGVISAHTGQFPVDAEDVELGGPGERLDPSAPDFPLVVADVTGDIRFPSDETHDLAVSWEVENYATKRANSRVASGQIRLWTAGNAVCAWSDLWAKSLRVADEPTEEEAASVILEARAWTAITDTDSSFANDSEFAWLPDLERAIRSHDASAAREALRGHQACLPPGLAPELGLDDQW
ncbi:hypothetical protein [Nocardioides sp.]|uniref:hypothetical protein n=1 Tax=Nocardioides sp. TaxID=35761 RepID=UPI002B273EDE|nr:hypothetical protein [Nocardioides sp.]